MKTKINCIGQSSVKIEMSKNIILFDPLKTDKKADIVLLSGKIIPETKLLKKKTPIIIPKYLEEKEIIQAKTKEQKEIYETDDIKIEVIPAYRIDKIVNPLRRFHNGYMITDKHTKETVYIAGPTDVIPEMNLIESTICVLPTEGPCMDVFEAVAATNVVHADLYVPNAYAENEEEGLIACERFTKKCHYDSDLAR